MITYAHQLTARDASYNGRPVDDDDNDDINDDSLSLYFYFFYSSCSRSSRKIINEKIH